MKQPDEARISPASIALERSLQRALRNQKRARKKLKPDPVHDFRVALRRCRTLAEGLSTLDPDPAWQRLRKSAKRLQKGMSDLRDVQVLEHWLKPLHLTAGPACDALQTHFEKRERRARREARDTLDSFPRKRWKRWSRGLPARAELIPMSEPQLARLVLDQLNTVIDLHQRWAGQPGPQAWHELRVTVKRFRYMTESFLPELNQAWTTELQRAQDLLGEGHDLDVLRGLLLKLAEKKSLPESAVSRVLSRVESAAQKRRNEYVSLISKPNGKERASDVAKTGSGSVQTLWEKWRAKLQPVASLSHPDAAKSARSAARRALRARAQASRYPDRPRRLSSAQ